MRRQRAFTLIELLVVIAVIAILAALLFLDTITPEVGPTRVVPGSHRSEALPPRDREHEPLPDEVAVCVEAGDAILINGALWHTGGCNRSDGLRRAVYLYYGYWWLRR